MRPKWASAWVGRGLGNQAVSGLRVGVGWREIGYSFGYSGRRLEMAEACASWHVLYCRAPGAGLSIVPFRSGAGHQNGTSEKWPFI